jgi:hypothetical protein
MSHVGAISARNRDQPFPAPVLDGCESGPGVPNYPGVLNYQGAPNYSVRFRNMTG